MPRPPAVGPPFALVLVLAFALVVPTAIAHLARDRPHIQPSEENRRVDVEMAGTSATFILNRTLDAFEDLVKHTIDPARWSVTTEYRPQPSDPTTAFVVRWNLTRIVEYRDSNTNARFEPKSDTIVRSWPFAKFAWTVSQPRDVSIGAAAAKDVAWTASASGAPTLKLQADSAGSAFTDEGASVRSQDAIMYLDLANFTPRDVGDLYAIEGVVTAPGADVAPDLVDASVLPNGTAGLLASADRRLAGLDWGAQATLDKIERSLNLTIDPRAADGTRAFRIDFPIFDKTLHMVFVATFEYTKPPPKVTPWPVAVAPLALALVALGLRRR